MINEQDPPEGDLPPITSEFPADETPSLAQSATPATDPTALEPIQEFATLEDILRSQPALPSSETPAEAAETLEPVAAMVISTDELPPTPANTIEKIKEYSETLAPQHPPIPAQFPFSLKIEGKLSESEREKLVSLLNLENVGIREIDLEPQFEAGRILIPRISEYAGILLIQTLRDATATFQLGPSEMVFTSEQSDAPLDSSLNPEDSTLSVLQDSEFHKKHLADSIPILTSADLPGLNDWTVIDGVMASAVIKAQIVEITRSKEFEEIVEALQNELRHKAFRRGATAILNYDLKLTPLATPTQYRIVASGTAIHHNTSHQDFLNA